MNKHQGNTRIVQIKDIMGLFISSAALVFVSLAFVILPLTS